MQRDELAVRRVGRRRIELMGGDGCIDTPASHLWLLANHDRQRWVVCSDRHECALRSALLDRAGGDRNQGHDEVSRVGVLLIAGFGQRELPAYATERIQNVSDGHGFAVPRDLRRGLRLGAHGRCHSLPSAWISLSAAEEPHVPAAYMVRGGRSSRQAASMGSMNVHAASTSSARVKSVGSPIMQSSSRRSYASGVSIRNDDMYVKSIATFRRRNPALG